MTGFGEEHEMLRRSLRELVDREVRPNVAAWEEAGAVPRSFFRRLGDLGFLGVRLSPEYGGSGLDFWHTAVLVQELVRCGSVAEASPHASEVAKTADPATSAIVGFGGPINSREASRFPVFFERVQASRRPIAGGA